MIIAHLNVSWVLESIKQKNYERRKAHRRFFSDPYRYGKALLDPPKSGELKMDRGELEEHLTNTYSDYLRHIPLQVRRDIPVVSLLASMFSLASPSLEEVRRVIRKARNRRQGPIEFRTFCISTPENAVFAALPHRESMAFRQGRR